jgi:hypothetical protein
VSTSYKRTWSALTSTVAVVLIAVLAAALFISRAHRLTTTPPPPSAGTPLTAVGLAGINLCGIALPSATEGWAVGGTIPDPHYDARLSHAPFVQPILLREHAGQWYLAAVPPGLRDASAELVSIAFVAPNNGWAIAINRLPPNSDGILFSQVLHYNGQRWTTLPQLFPAHLSALVFASPVDGWAVGEGYDASGQALVVHYDGRTWQTLHDPVFTNVALTAAGASADGVWAAGMDFSQFTGPDGNAPETLLHFDGTRWTKAAITPARARLASIALLPRSTGWAVGTVTAAASSTGAAAPGSHDRAVILHLNGGTWTEQSVAGSAPGQTVASWNALALTADGSGWIVGTDGARLHVMADTSLGTAIPAPPGQAFQLQGIAVNDADNGWAVGLGGILRLTHGVWQLYQP